MKRGIPVFIKILLSVLVVLCTVTGVVLVHFLPFKNQTLTRILNARLYCYNLTILVNFILLAVAIHFFGQDGTVSDDDYFVYEVIAGLSFIAAVFLSDRYAVRKRINPLKKQYPEEYEAFGFSRIGEGIVDSFFMALILWIFLMFNYYTIWAVN